MFYLTRQERFILLAIGALILFSATLRYFNNSSFIQRDLQPKQDMLETGDPVFSSININQASMLDLEKIPGIGPVTARGIVEYRRLNGPFEGIEDLKKVKGIGEKTAQSIQNYIDF
ncbi:MAG: helix-hairpin-helix domain-containing protein [Candidatus Omnitrophica bacterium]|nr:helix-hairpin-helix domain-containing protein [Candidatus Omnitrophota bacterium]